ncbi:MAG: FkbM family methyltransferase [Terriglobia bacterium]
MNLLAASNQTAPGKLLRLPLKLIPKQAVVPMRGEALKGMRWVAGSSDHGCWLGIYELPQRRLFEKAVKQGSVVFDIGAHAGFYTLLASALAGPEGRVFAFEPFPPNMLKLKTHLLLNGISNVSTFEAAVSNREGYFPFEAGSSTTQGRLSKRGSLRVRTVTLDNLISRGDAPVPACLKIDAEGEESNILAGAVNLLTRAHPVVFLSTHSGEQRLRCSALLQSLGYKIRVIGAAPENAAQLVAS